jgi:hypothetical protein
MGEIWTKGGVGSAPPSVLSPCETRSLLQTLHQRFFHLVKVPMLFSQPIFYAIKENVSGPLFSSSLLPLFLDRSELTLPSVITTVKDLPVSLWKGWGSARAMADTQTTTTCRLPTNEIDSQDYETKNEDLWDFAFCSKCMFVDEDN